MQRPHLEILEDRCVPAVYAVTNLGALGGYASYASDLNEAGQVVGYGETADGFGHAFLWDHGTMIDLGTLGGSYSYATGINDLGQVVGYADVPGAGIYDAFLITPQGGVWFKDTNLDGRNDLMINLTVGLGGSNGSAATDINNAGQVVGWYRVVDPWSDYSSEHAFLWDANNGMTDLGLPNGFTGSYAAGINASGQVAGSASYDDPLTGSHNTAFLWDAVHGMTILGVGSAYSDSQATAVNDAGEVVGSQWNTLNGILAAFRWTPASANGLSGSFTDLGTLPGDTDSSAAAINNVGQIVGYSSYGDEWGYYPHAFNWDASGGMESLQNQVLPGSDAILQFAEAINDRGAIAVDGYDSQGISLAYLLTPIPPGTPLIKITDAPAVTEGNAGSRAATFTVTLSMASDQIVTVGFTTAAGSAVAGSDYVAASGTLTFAPGQLSKTITVRVIGDRLPEPNETFFVNLSGPTNGTIADGQGIGAITDDEPRISISDVSMKEGKKNQTTLFTFTVTLSAAYDQAVTLSFRTVDGTAKAGDQDYVGKTGTLTFAPGETTKTITIEVKGDNKKEADETFYLDLFGNGSSSLLDKWRGIGTILNDD